MKNLAIGSVVLLLSGCANFGDTVLSRSGDNTGLKGWEVQQTFKWGKKRD